ncbi:MAG: lipopolysaccharide assembly protein LapA domain-containing protein [Cyanobacteria bacterium P01_H01_bin.35]
MQKFISPIISSIILALWISGIAILSVQNATPISVKFIGFQSIQIPVGVILSFSVGIGVIISSILLPPLFNLGQMKERQEDF